MSFFASAPSAGGKRGSQDMGEKEVLLCCFQKSGRRRRRAKLYVLHTGAATVCYGNYLGSVFMSHLDRSCTSIQLGSSALPPRSLIDATGSVPHMECFCVYKDSLSSHDRQAHLSGSTTSDAAPSNTKIVFADLTSSQNFLILR